MSQPRMPYGDDDIFMNQVAVSLSCDVEPDPDALVSQTGLTPSRWFQQKKAAFEERKQVSKMDRKKKNRISWLECEIGKLETRMKEIETILAAPTEKDDIMDLTREYLECKRDLDAKTDEWVELSE